MYARLQHMSALRTNRISAQVQMQASRGLVECQAEQQILQRLQWQLAQ